MSAHHDHDHSGASHNARDEDRIRLQAWWPFVVAHLPALPARVLEIGCGPLGGFVPMMLEAGFDAVGVDPVAPEGPAYRRTEFESHPLSEPLDAVVACTSLHHVADLTAVLDRVASAIRPGGALVVLEWAWERFDDDTAQWSFAHAPTAVVEDEPGWLVRQRQEWMASGLSWGEYLSAWAIEAGLHTGDAQLVALADRFETRVLATGPYLFADLDGVDEQTEQEAIDAGQIQATGIRYVGVVPSA